jgi:starch synthase (maltosyl-transferring)
MAVETITHQGYEFRIDTETGALKGLRLNDGPQMVGHVDPVVTLAADVAWIGIKDAPTCIGFEVEPEGTLRIDVRLGPLLLHDRYTPVEGLIERRVMVENTTHTEVQLTGVRMAIGGIAIGDPVECLFEAPANTVKPRIPLKVAASQPVKSLVLKKQYGALPDSVFAPGARVRWNTALADAPDSGPGLLVVHNPEAGWSLMTWYVSDVEAGTPWVTGDGTHVTLGFDAWLCGWMAPGAILQAGTQYIVLHQGDYQSALARYVEYYTHTGIMPPIYGRVDNATDWTGVFETHPGMYGGFSGFTDTLERLSALGIDTIYLLPVMEHENLKQAAWDGNWDAIGSPYAMHDFSVLEPSLGSERDFREMVHTAHDLGMKVLLDFVAQGSSIDSHYVQDHPDWYARDEQGNMLHSHGWSDTWSLDWANPDYQAYMLDWTMRFVRDYQVDGYRVDAPHGKEPNWSREIPYHASTTNLGASEMLENMRWKLMEARPGRSWMYCELFGPLWIRSHDISNDYHPYAMVYELFHGTLTPYEYNEYLRDYWAILPKAEDGSPSPRICFTETHDTRYWPAPALRGSSISKVLLGIMVMAGFVPMIWAGQEQGQEDFIKGLLLSRRENAVIRRGKYLFNEVVINQDEKYPRQDARPQEWMYNLIRYDDQSVVWGAASLYPSLITYRCHLPVEKLPSIDPSKTYRLRELITYSLFSEYGKETWTGAELADIRVTLEMYRPYMFRIEAAEG